MAKGDTKTNQYLDIAANGTRADLPTDTCCETRSQTLIREVAERIIDLEEEVQELEDNPDVTDIVDTYADLMAYDTSKLTDRDIIRVLNDETHNGESTYYRYSKATGSWTYIGSTGQRAKQSDWDEDDPTDMAFIKNKPFGSESVESDFEQEPTTTSGSTPDPNYVWFIEQFQDYALHEVLANFDDGDTVYATITYSVNGVERSDTGKFTLTFDDDKANLDYDAPAGSRWYGAYISEVNLGDTTVRWPVLATDSGATVYITGIEYEKVKQIDAKYIPDTGPNINVVQTTGTSTTDVMSQNAVTGMVYADPSTKEQVQIGAGASVRGAGGVAIGLNSSTGTALGQIALGATTGISSARLTQAGVMSIQAGNTFQGYNSTVYRLLEGLYDPQSAHDAATKGYVDSAVPATLTDAQYEALWSNPNALNAILTNITTGQGV